MGSITTQVEVDADPTQVWEVIKDFDRPDLLTPGFVASVRTEGAERVVSFAHGGEVWEMLVDRDDVERRMSYAATRGRATHHNASFQVFASGNGSRIVWITDVLPDELLDYVGSNMRQGAEAIARRFSSTTGNPT